MPRPAGAIVRLAAILVAVAPLSACAFPADPSTSGVGDTSEAAAPSASPGTPSPSPSPSPTASVIDLGPPSFTVSAHETGAAPVTVSLGWEHGCTSFDDGSVWCWGRNGSGQLGRGFTSVTEEPGVASVADGIAAVGVGSFGTCAVTDASTVECWGAGFYGTLGDGSRVDHLTPVTVLGLDDVRQLGVGKLKACAVTGDGGVWCWGYTVTNVVSRTVVPTPTNMDLPRPAVKSVGGDYFQCALLVDGSVWCWGLNEFGQFGVPGKTAEASPTRVAGIEGAIDLDVGDRTTCAILSDHTVSCWGYEVFDHDGKWLEDAPPTLVPGIHDAIQLASGPGFACALNEDRRVVCWGVGYVGDWHYERDAPFTPPTPVGGLDDVIAVEVGAGAQALCVILGDGTLECWTEG